MEDVKLQEKIKVFLSTDHGSGSGYGYGDGSGYGDGYGYGYGSGDGSGYGYGYGDGSGDGSGYGYGSGSGDGSGYGYGSGDGVCMFDGKSVHIIDGLQTIIMAVHGNIARGYVLQEDFTLTPCVVVKGNNLFAHGDTLRDAMAALTDKMFDDMPEEERIAEFIKAHPDINGVHPHKDLFDWHHRLTGSCEMGRKAFMKDHGFEMDGQSTVAEFIEATKNAYNGSVIRNLEKAYK